MISKPFEIEFKNVFNSIELKIDKLDSYHTEYYENLETCINTHKKLSDNVATRIFDFLKMLDIMNVSETNEALYNTAISTLFGNQNLKNDLSMLNVCLHDNFPKTEKFLKKAKIGRAHV